MITYSDLVNKRKVVYVSISDNLEEFRQLELTDWVIFVIADDLDNPLLEAFANLCIDKDVLYMTATGKACSAIDDLFDTLIVRREMEGGRLPSWMKSEEDVLMTSWDYDFAEGFWFITSVARYEEQPINTVVVADLTTYEHSKQIEDLIVNINKSWVPEG